MPSDRNRRRQSLRELRDKVLHTTSELSIIFPLPWRLLPLLLILLLLRLFQPKLTQF
jgi:hypothetical protein